MRLSAGLFSDHPRARWVVPATAVVVISAGSLLASRTASADTGLPARTAAQLLVDVRTSTERSFSGTVVQTANLGLPQLPGVSKPGSAATSGSSLTSMLSGTHTWRVWADGPTKARVALVGGSGESDIIRNGSDVWVWSSQDKTASHHTLDSATAAKGGAAPSAAPTDLPTTPEEAAQQALAAIQPTTDVTTAGTANVAGRNAYELVLDPKSTATKVAQVRIAIDADAHIPLRVQVYAKSQANPAFEVGFTSVDFATPEARQFAFTPPPGTAVTEGKDAAGATAPATPAAAHKVVGKGWERVLVASMPTQSADPNQQKQLQGVLSAIPKVSGAWGSGRVVDGTLFSAVIADDGRVAVGAVAPDALYAALSAS